MRVWFLLFMMAALPSGASAQRDTRIDRELSRDADDARRDAAEMRRESTSRKADKKKKPEARDEKPAERTN